MRAENDVSAAHAGIQGCRRHRLQQIKNPLLISSQLEKVLACPAHVATNGLRLNRLF